MSTRLFVGSLGYSVDDQQLGEFFAGVGTVVSAKVIVDRDSNRSKGFGFVEMSSESEAKNAIDTLNGKELGGRQVTVNEAKPMPERSQRENRRY